MNETIEVAITYGIPCPFCDWCSPERGRIIIKGDEVRGGKLGVISDTKGEPLLDHLIAVHAGRGTKRVVPHG
jgi:hypothetical protein